MVINFSIMQRRATAIIGRILEAGPVVLATILLGIGAVSIA
jgi:hypothetical protein